MTIPAAEEVSDPSSKPRQRQRRDIQGLRAVAVLAVVANHLWPQRLQGGFVGVDIFFVISGFLITGLLLREYQRTGGVSFKRFYLRRLKRLVPAATLTILATALTAFLVLPSARAKAVLWDGVASFLFAQNWRLAATSTDYFNENEATSPLQHYWSLSVEEQFYLVWPWVLLLMFWIFARNARATEKRIRVVAGATIGVILVASFAWAMVDAVAAPSIAYFSTFSRGWELGVGALLAVVAPLLSNQPSWARTFLAYGGLVAMAVSMFAFNSATVWPAPWALIPVAGAAMVLVSGLGGEARYNPALTNRLSNYVGDISYSLYLWHFPVLIFGAFLFPDAGKKGDLAFLAVSFLLAACAYHLVEEPIHKSPLWASGANKSTRLWREWLLLRRKSLFRAAAASAVAVAVVTTSVAFAPSNNPLDRIPASGLNAPGANGAVVDALRLEEWPAELTPTLDAPRSEKYVTAWSVDKCLAEGMTPAEKLSKLAESCVYGDPEGDRTMVILGDSVAITWATAFDDTLAGLGWRAIALTAEMCPASGVSVVRDTGTAFPGCSEFQEEAQAYIEEMAPDVVLLSETATTVNRLSSGNKGPDAVKEIVSGFAEKTAAFRTVGANVVLVESVPRTRSMRDCFDQWAGPSSCALTVEGGTATHEKAVRQAGESPGVPVIDTSWYFCIEGVCPPAIDGILVRPDGAHPSDAYARHIGPSVWESVEAAVKSEAVAPAAEN